MRAPLLARLLFALTLLALARPASATEHGDAPAAHSAPQDGHGDGHAERSLHGLNFLKWYGGGEGEHHGAPPLLFALFNFALLLWALRKYALPKLRAGVLAEHEAVKKELDEARRIRAEAEAKLADYDQRLREIDQEIAGVLQGLRDEADAERKRILEAASAQAERTRSDAAFTIAQEFKQARLDLEAEIVGRATALAEELLKTRVEAGDEQRLADDFVRRVGGPA